MLTIKALNVSVQDDKKGMLSILRGIDLAIKPGEIHAMMGPNGSGKSTLSNVLAGRDDYQIDSGHIQFDQDDLLSLSPERRAARGIFLAFQYPTEIPGVNNMYFLRSALNAQRRSKQLPPIDAADFLKLVKDKLQTVGLDQSFLYRSVNEGFSGGEKKRNELLQMLVLEPRFIILDEIDSGLDVDALKRLATSVNAMRNSERSMLLITHYERLLQYIEPHYVHIMAHGRIIKTGDKLLAKEIEQRGYDWLLNEMPS